MALQKLLIDTNVLLDFLLARKPFDMEAKRIFELAVNGRVSLYISINSFIDIIYFVSKEYDIETVKDKMNELLSFITVIDAGHNDALEILKMTGFKDIEAALQIQCAMKEGIEYIITRNIRDYRCSSIIALFPEDYK